MRGKLILEFDSFGINTLPEDFPHSILKIRREIFRALRQDLQDTIGIETYINTKGIRVKFIPYGVAFDD